MPDQHPQFPSSTGLISQLPPNLPHSQSSDTASGIPSVVCSSMPRMLSGTSASTSSLNNFLPLLHSASAGRASRYSLTTILASTSSALPSFPKPPPFNTSGEEAPPPVLPLPGRPRPPPGRRQTKLLRSSSPIALRQTASSPGPPQSKRFCRQKSKMALHIRNLHIRSRLPFGILHPHSY